MPEFLKIMGVLMVDVLIIGGGASGLVAAIAAARTGEMCIRDRAGSIIYYHKTRCLGALYEKPS